MVMSSHQIGAIAQQQQAMFGNFQSYAQQITPPYAAGGASPMGGNPMTGYAQQPAPSYQPVMGGYSAGPPPAPPPPMMAPQTGMYMPPSGNLFNMGMAAMQSRPGSYVGQAFGEQLAGTALGGLSSGMQGLGTLAGVAGLAGSGLGMLGVGGSVVGGLAAAGSAPVTMGIAGAAYGAQQMYAGFQQQQNVNRVLKSNFGGMMGIGSGAGGMGFSAGEMGGISDMVREMSSKDMFVGFDELTRVMDKTAQMGMYRGVQSAKQFREKFRQTVASLKEVAETMHSSLEEAAQFMGQQKQMGFFSGKDINQNLMRTKLMAGATGMSVEQLQQAGMQGTQMGRAMGMLGRTGARVMQETTANLAMGMRTGAISEELIAEATGGLTGAEGAQAAAGRMMQLNQRWLRRGVGRVELAALWNPETGGINQDVLEQVRGGQMSFQQMRSLGRRNIAKTGGRQSEFFLNEERLRGQAMEQAGGDLMLGALRSHLDKRGVDMDSPIAQRWLQRQAGMSRSEADLFIQQAKELPGLLRERRIQNRQQIENEAMGRARKGMGVGGLKRRWSQWWESNVENPFRKIGSDLTTSITEAVEEFQQDLEGTVKLQVGEKVKAAVQELATTGKSDLIKGAVAWQQGLDTAKGRQDYESGFAASLGRALGTRGPSVESRMEMLDIGKGGRMSGLYHQQVVRRAQQEGRAVTMADKTAFLNKFSTDIMRTGGQLGFSSKAMRGLGTAARAALEANYGAGKLAAFSQLRDARARAVAGEGGNETQQFLDQQIAMLSRSDPALAEAFAKTPVGPQRYALLREIQKETGLKEGDIRLAPVDVMERAAGRDVGSIAAMIEASKTRQGEIVEEFAAMMTGDTGGGEFITKEVYQKHRKAGLFSKEEYVIDPETGKKKKVTLKFKRADVERLGEQGMAPKWAVDVVRKQKAYAQRMTKAFSKKDARSLAALALKGGPEGEKALKDLQAMGATGQGPDQDTYREVAAIIAKGTDEQKNKLKEMFAGDMFTEVIGAFKRESDVGKALADSLTSNENLQQALNEVGPDADDELQEIANLRERAMTEEGGIDDKALNDAYKKERAFLAKYANDPKAGRMIGALEASGGGTYMAEGLREAQTVMGLGKGKGSTTRRVLDYMLGKKFGLKGGLRGIGLKDRQIRQLVKSMEKGGMTAESFREALKGGAKAFEGLTDKQIQEALGGVFGMAEKGVDTGELTKLAAERGAEASQAARAQGAGGQVESLNSLALKQVSFLDQLVKGQDSLVKMTAQNKGMNEDQIKELIGAIKGGGGNAEGTTQPTGGSK